MRQVKKSITLRLPVAMINQVEDQLSALDLSSASQFIRHAIQEKLERTSMMSLIKSNEDRNNEAMKAIMRVQKHQTNDQKRLSELIESADKSVQLLLQIAQIR